MKAYPNKQNNPLGTERIPVLLRCFAIPSIIAMLVSSLYNIVDQFFIGRSIGELGNAATNIAFPLSICCTATALLFGIGGASAFNLAMGEGKKEQAVDYLGTAITMMVTIGVLLSFVTLVFLEPLLCFFGSPENVLPYANSYTGITAWGFPFAILSLGGGHLIRADGRPQMTMICNITGAIVNTILDALFVFRFGWGMQGAAFATVIGQMIAAGLVTWNLAHCQTITLKAANFRLQYTHALRVIALGAAPCFNQLSMMVVQIVMNKSLKYYGALSVYGEAIPLACVGIISKVNMVLFSIIIGISQSLQPIASFNYGARQYKRVREGYLLAAKAGCIVSVISFLLFQFLPRQIISLFGDGSEVYFQFAIEYFRIYMFFTCVNFLQPITSNFFTAIGKPKFGMFLSLTRQIILLLPLILIFPLFMGIDGIMYAGPAADGVAALLAVVMVCRELKKDVYKYENI